MFGLIAFMGGLGFRVWGLDLGLRVVRGFVLEMSAARVRLRVPVCR